MARPLCRYCKIESDIRLLAPTGNYDSDEYEKSDGIRAAIQVKGNEVWSLKISKGDTSSHTANVNSISVNTGDRIYFRLQSGDEKFSNGAFDQVEWAPVISYVGETSVLTPDGYQSAVFDAAESNISSAQSAIPISGDNIVIKGVLNKPVTSDDVTLRIYTSNEPTLENGDPNPGYHRSLSFEKTFAWDEEHSGEFIADITNSNNDVQLECELYSKTNIAWDKVKWSPVVQDGNSTTPCIVDYRMYPRLKHKGASYVVGANDSIIVIKPTLTLSPGAMESLHSP